MGRMGWLQSKFRVQNRVPMLNVKSEILCGKFGHTCKVGGLSSCCFGVVAVMALQVMDAQVAP